MAILSFRFISTTFLARFIRKEDKRALLSLFLEALSGGSREADGRVADGRVVYSKDTGSGKAGSEKVSRFLADFALSLLLLSTKPYKKRFGTYFLKLY